LHYDGFQSAIATSTFELLRIILKQMQCTGCYDYYNVWDNDFYTLVCLRIFHNEK